MELFSAPIVGSVTLVADMPALSRVVVVPAPGEKPAKAYTTQSPAVNDTEARSSLVAVVNA